MARAFRARSLSIRTVSVGGFTCLGIPSTVVTAIHPNNKNPAPLHLIRKWHKNNSENPQNVPLTQPNNMVDYWCGRDEWGRREGAGTMTTEWELDAAGFEEATREPTQDDWQDYNAYLDSLPESPPTPEDDPEDAETSAARVAAFLAKHGLEPNFM
jgi:hypothetical protein